jgi:DNA-binding NarL/FixJ family response regulator
MKILVVDDHVLIREASHAVFKELNPDAEILEAADCREALRLLHENADVGMILLDLALPDRDGLDVLSELRAGWPHIPVVVLSAHLERDRVLKALELGAAGFIPKTARRGVMLGALKLVFSGGVYVPPEILAEGDSPSPPQQATAAGTSPGDLGLTQRQLDVLALMMQGKSNKAICRLLNLAETTVKNHVTAIFKALKVSNRTEAVIAANALGWQLQPPQS